MRMKTTAWAIGGLGTVVGLVLIAAVLLTDALPPGFDGQSGLGPDARAVVIGVVIVAVSLGIAASMRRSDRWAHHVFVVLGVLGAAAATWWAVAELLG